MKGVKLDRVSGNECNFPSTWIFCCVCTGMVEITTVIALSSLVTQ